MGERIRLRRAKGWRMPPNTVKVDRTTKWGNPFIVGKHGTQAECVHFFRLLLGYGLRTVSSGPPLAEQDAYMRYAHAHIDELCGRDLACWCAPDAPCHADVLLEAVAAKQRRLSQKTQETENG